MFSAFFSQARLELHRAGILPHRENPDEVGDEDVWRALELGVLVEEVVEVPALVAHPEIVVVPLHDVGEGHEVGGEDLVHVPERVEGVELVVPRPPFEVGALVEVEPGRRMQALAESLHDAVGGVGGEEVDGDVAVELPELPGHRDVPLDVAEPDGARQPEDPSRRRPARARRRRLTLGRGRDRVGLDGSLQQEVPDQPVHLGHVATVEEMPAALEGDQAGTGDRLDHPLGMGVRHDPVLGPVERQRRDPNLAQQRVDARAVDGPERLDEDIGGRLAGPCDAVLNALQRVGLRKSPREEPLPPPVEVTPDHRGDLLLEGLGHGLRVLAAQQDQARDAFRVLGRVPERQHPGSTRPRPGRRAAAPPRPGRPGSPGTGCRGRSPWPAGRSARCPAGPS